MNTFRKGIAVAIAGTIAGTMAMGVQASLIGLDPDKEGVTTTELPANNTYANDPSNDPELSVGQEGFKGATIAALTDKPMRLTFTYLFSDAGFTNSFSYNGQELFNNNSSAPGSSRSFIYQDGMGPLDFFFTAAGYTSEETVTNEENSGDKPRFITFLDPENSNELHLTLDDHGAGPDGDFDDLIVKVAASRVPEPGTLALLGLGLAGMGLRFGKKFTPTA